jgi:hypothetical protein
MGFTGAYTFLRGIFSTHRNTKVTLKWLCCLFPSLFDAPLTMKEVFGAITKQNKSNVFGCC